MARIAMDESHTPELRARMFAELAQYVYPKRKPSKSRATTLIFTYPRTGNEKEIGSTGPSALPTPSDNELMR